MGYYTYYSMSAQNIKSYEEYKSILEVVGHFEIFYKSDYDDNIHEAEFYTYDECKWYDHTADMKNISRLFPNVVFKLHGEGEDRDDIWDAYYQNGFIEVCPAEIVYPKPKTIKWND